MSLGTNRELAENKLILLYLIDKINMSVSNLQITKIILENKFMNYFLLQQFLNELCDGSLLTCELVEGKTFYSITQNGRQTLNYFHNLIPFAVKAKIDETISSIKSSIKNETRVTADFVPLSENEYVVTCKVQEGNFCLIDLKVAVGTKNDARTICENWKKSSQEIYPEIIASLIGKRD